MVTKGKKLQKKRKGIYRPLSPLEGCKEEGRIVGNPLAIIYFLWADMSFSPRSLKLTAEYISQRTVGEASLDCNKHWKGSSVYVCVSGFFSFLSPFLIYMVFLSKWLLCHLFLCLSGFPSYGSRLLRFRDRPARVWILNFTTMCLHDLETVTLSSSAQCFRVRWGYGFRGGTVVNHPPTSEGDAAGLGSLPLAPPQQAALG